MLVALGKIALHLIPKDKLLIWGILGPLGLVIFIGLLFSGPGALVQTVPVGDDQQYNFYISAANQIKNETGVDVNYQQIMAIDAVVLQQDFTQSSQSRAYSYKKYFIRQEQKEIDCPESTTGTSSVSSQQTSTGQSQTAAQSQQQSQTQQTSSPKCYKTVYYARAYDDVLQLLIQDHNLTEEDIPYVKKFMTFTLTMTDFSDSDEEGQEEGGLTMEGDIEVGEGVYGWPLPKGHTRVTSPFGMRIHPVTGEKKGHLGVDLAAATGTSIYAMADGVVTFVGEYGTGGNAIFISHQNGIVSKYMHLSEFNVREGQSVAKGDLIALSGATGRVTGPHLHFQIEVKGLPVDPLRYF